MTAGDARLRFEILGSLRVLRAGEAIQLGGPKPRALLGTLLLHPGEPVGVDQLVEALWDGEPPASAAVNLRSYVRTLRRALDGETAEGGTRLETRSPGYLMRIEPGELDLLDFEDLAARGRAARERGDTAEAARLWRQALDLWRGRPLDGVRGGPRLDAAVVRLEERRLRVAEAWIDAQLALGRHAELVGELRGMVANAPLHEPLWARLMVALHRTGRTADALAAYAQAREHLVEELGVEPGAQLQRLHRAILAGDPVTHPDDGQTDRPVPPPPDEAVDSAPGVVDACPYQGLMPFDAADAEWFFGRERLVAELVTYLSSHLSPPSMVAVVGPSGSGKSSLLRAGLLPALAEGVLPDARDWPQAVLTPGSEPLAALCDALTRVRIPGTPPPEPDDLADPHRLRELVARLSGHAPGRRVVLVVDQLEELFMVCRDERKRQAFVTAVCALAGAHTAGTGDAPDVAPAVVVLGLRADFYGHCIAYPELIPVLAGGQVVVGPMTADELRHAITRPAARAGLTLEPGLVDVVLGDLGIGPGDATPEPGSLPLLSHALLATWQLRDGRRLTLEGYRKAGGIDGAIATTAEAVHDELDAGQRIIARRLFTRLVALGDGTEDTSRRIRSAELFDGRSPDEAAAIHEVLDALAQARLIVLGSDTVELAHEALITRWPRLQEWLTEDREGLKIHRALTDAAQTWEALGRDPGALYRGAQLNIAREWAAAGGHRDDMNALEQAFLDASVDLESADESDVRRRRVMSRRLVIAIVCLLLVAVLIGVVALWQARRNAVHEQADESRALARVALDLPAARRPAAMLLAAEAFRAAPTPQARDALVTLAPEPGYRDTMFADGITVLAFSPDGTTLAQGADDGTVALWEAAARKRRAVLAFDRNVVTTAVAFSPDGKLLACGYSDGTVVFWDVAERARAAELRSGGPGAVRSLAFSPDGELLATGGASGAVVLWDVSERSEVAKLDAGVTAAKHGPASEPAADDVTSLAFSADGATLATGTGGGALMLWNPAERSRIATLAPTRYDREQHPVEALAFAPDGATLAVAQRTAEPGQEEVDEDARTHYALAFWDPRAQRLVGLAESKASGFGLSDLAFSDDGDLLAVASMGVSLMDMSGGVEDARIVMQYGNASVNGLAFSPTGDVLAIGEAFDAITLLDPSVRQIVADDTIDQVALGRDGRTLAISDDSGHVGVWDIMGPRPIQRLDRRIDPFETLALHPGGRHVALIGNEAVELHPVDPDDERVLRVSLSDDDPTARRRLDGLVTLDAAREIVEVYRAGGDPIRRRMPGIQRAALSPDRDVLATMTASGVRLWAMPELTPMGWLGAPDQFSATPLAAFSTDGTTLATVDENDVTLWDVRERTPIASFTERKPPVDVAVAPDGRTVALALDDAISVWDAVERVRIVTNLPVTYSSRNQVMFVDEGSALLATDGRRIRSWDLDPRRITARICSTLDRGLTRQEWAEFVPERPYHATCS